MEKVMGSYRIILSLAVALGLGGFVFQSSNASAGGDSGTDCRIIHDKYDKLLKKYCDEHPEDEDECRDAGCLPGANAAGKSAQGFYGNGGPNPVQAGHTCLSGTLTSTPGSKCDPLNPNSTKRCKNIYTYSTRVCSFGCK